MLWFPLPCLELAIINHWLLPFHLDWSPQVTNCLNVRNVQSCSAGRRAWSSTFHTSTAGMKWVEGALRLLQGLCGKAQWHSRCELGSPMWMRKDREGVLTSYLRIIDEFEMCFWACASAFPIENCFQASLPARQAGISWTCMIQRLEVRFCSSLLVLFYFSPLIIPLMCELCLWMLLPQKY